MRSSFFTLFLTAIAPVLAAPFTAPSIQPVPGIYANEPAVSHYEKRGRIFIDEQGQRVTEAVGQLSKALNGRGGGSRPATDPFKVINGEILANLKKRFKPTAADLPEPKGGYSPGYMYMGISDWSVPEKSGLVNKEGFNALVDKALEWFEYDTFMWRVVAGSVQDATGELKEASDDLLSALVALNSPPSFAPAGTQDSPELLRNLNNYTTFKRVWKALGNQRGPLDNVKNAVMKLISLKGLDMSY